MEQKLLYPRDTAGSENTSLLKLIAILTMMVDHVGAVFFPSQKYILLRYIGRIAMPLFCWCMVVGACKTRNPYRYALRVLLTGILSQPFYALAFSLPFSNLNVFATLFCGLCAVIGIREKKYLSQLWAPMLALAIPHLVEMDYGTTGVLLIILLYLGRKHKWSIAAAFLAVCLWWWQGDALIFAVKHLMGITKYPLRYAKMYLNQVQGCAFIALPLMLIPLPGRIHLPKWFSYGIYGLHLGIIWAVDRFLL